ncbi:hypothetical protein N1851_005092 [Merluccius polli]|uniref:Uncharacterized protein n=1 Tax=Merluccius polli TaxID=89951 RepID=A0AA47N7C3_MERPO|nr:hypothetical protein N1851_005092 [Merluccius polli]
MTPSPENMGPIKTTMEKTFSHHRNWISTQSPTVADIVQQYPCFIDIPSLLDIVFGRLFDGKAEMFIRRSSIIPKLKQISILEKGFVSSLLDQTENQNDDELCHSMLQVLTHLLPPTASGRGAAASTRCSMKSAMSYLLDFVPHGTSIPSLCNSNEGSLRTHQPQLVCIGHLNSQARQFIIVVRSDKVAIPLHDDSLTCALDKLFTFFWVFNVACPTQLASFFIFLEYIYDLTVSTSARRSCPSVGAHWQASGFGLNQLSIYRCPICKQPVPGEIRKLHWHLRVVHSLSDSQDNTIICSQSSCQRTYHNLNSYSRHLFRANIHMGTIAQAICRTTL